MSNNAEYWMDRDQRDGESRAIVADFLRINACEVLEHLRPRNGWMPHEWEHVETGEVFKDHLADAPSRVNESDLLAWAAQRVRQLQANGIATAWSISSTPYSP